MQPLCLEPFQHCGSYFSLKLNDGRSIGQPTFQNLLIGANKRKNPDTFVLYQDCSTILVDLTGIEPATSSMPWRRSPR